MPYVLIYRSSTIHCFTEFLLNSVFISSRHYARAERSNCLQTQINKRWWPWWFCRLTHCQTWAVIEVLPLLMTKTSSCRTLSTGHITSTHGSEFGWTFAQRHIVVFPARLPQRRCITHQGASYDFIRFALERQGLVHHRAGMRTCASICVRSSMGAYAGAARRRVYLATEILRPPSGHRPDRRRGLCGLHSLLH